MRPAIALREWTLPPTSVLPMFTTCDNNSKTTNVIHRTVLILNTALAHHPYPWKNYFLHVGFFPKLLSEVVISSNGADQVFASLLPHTHTELTRRPKQPSKLLSWPVHPVKFTSNSSKPVLLTQAAHGSPFSLRLPVSLRTRSLGSSISLTHLVKSPFNKLLDKSSTCVNNDPQSHSFHCAPITGLSQISLSKHPTQHSISQITTKRSSPSCHPRIPRHKHTPRAQGQKAASSLCRLS